MGPRRGEAVDRGRVYAAFAGAITGSLRTGATNGTGPGLDATALALRDAVAANPADDAVAAVLDKVDAALAGAVSRLGLSDAAAQRVVADFRAELATRVDALARVGAVSSAPASQTSPTSPAATTAPSEATTPAATTVPAATTAPTSAVASASYRVVQKTGIELLTQEGDVVRISLRTKEGFRAAGGYSPAGAYLQVAAYSKTRFSVEVQGSLSAQERAAIDDVLSQVDEIATDFYAGGTSSAFAAGAALDVDATQLAAVSLRMSQSTSLRVAARAEWSGPLLATATPRTPPTAPLPAGAEPAPTPPTSGEPPVGADAPVAGAAASSEGAATGSTPAATDAPATSGSPASSDAPATTAAPAASGRASALQSMTEFLVKLFDAFGTTTTAGRFEFTARAKLQLVVAAVEAAKLPAATTEASAAGMLGGVVAATEDRPAA